jgi:hypothetical protein
MYKSVVGQPICGEATNPKAIWRDKVNDGIEFSAFRQYKQPANFDGSCPQDHGISVKLTDTAVPICYNYDYLNALCFLVKFVHNSDGNQPAW